MQLVNIGKIEYWILIIILWGSVFTYLGILGFKVWRDKSSEKKLNSIKNYKSINPLVRFGINSFVIITILLLVTLIIFRPVFGVEQSEGSTKNLDIAMVVDISLSMNVKDYDNEESRLDGAKDVLTRLLKEDKGNRYALISFHSTADIEMPLSFDKNTAVTGIDTLRIVDSYASNGSSITNGLVAAQERLVNEDDNFGKNRKKIIILVTDGEIIEKEESDLEKTLDELKSKNIRVYTLGIGTKEGDKIPEYQFTDGTESYIFHNGEYAISKMDEENLKDIASDGGGKYFHGTPEFDTKELLTELENAAQFVDITEGDPIYKDAYFIFTPIILLLLVYLHIEPHNFIVQLRKKK